MPHRRDSASAPCRTRREFLNVAANAGVLPLLGVAGVARGGNEPDRNHLSEPFMTGLKQAFRNIYLALKDTKFTLFLLIIIAGWTVYWQFFYSLPIYIVQWVDTGIIYQGIHRILPGFADALATRDGIILAEQLITLAALAYQEVAPGVTVYSGYPISQVEGTRVTFTGIPGKHTPVAVEGASSILDDSGKRVETKACRAALCFQAEGGSTYLLQPQR